MKELHHTNRKVTRPWLHNHPEILEHDDEYIVMPEDIVPVLLSRAASVHPDTVGAALNIASLPADLIQILNDKGLRHFASATKHNLQKQVFERSELMAGYYGVDVVVIGHRADARKVGVVLYHTHPAVS